MPGRQQKAWAIVIILVVLGLPSALVFSHPRVRATLRLTRGFSVHPAEPRVFFEPGAETFADRIVAALPGAIARVEECQTKPFKPGYRVYVCASHESFTSRVGLSSESPVRGIAFVKDVWVSPKAFAFGGKDTHRQTLIHELSHLHLVQHLGWLRKTKSMPTWFVEGLADWMADTGGELISSSEATEALLSAPHFVPDSSGKLPLPKGARDYGVTWPMLHMQSRMFIEYLRSRNHTSFDEFVAALLDGEPFDVAFEVHLGEDVPGAWQSFIAWLEGGEVPTRDPWRPFRLLVGEWKGEGSGFGDVSDVTHRWDFVINGNFLRLITRSTPRSGGSPHEDVAYLSFDKDRGAFVFRQFLSEGFVNTYDVTVGNETPVKIVFEYREAESAGDMRARMLLDFVSINEYEMVLELAGADKTFAPCQSMRMKKIENKSEI